MKNVEVGFEYRFIFFGFRSCYYDTCIKKRGVGGVLSTYFTIIHNISSYFKLYFSLTLPSLVFLFDVYNFSSLCK